MASSQSMAPPVLISGAGPSGLMLASWLSKFSVPYRIVDKATCPYETSRAIAMHARTLEYYRMLGLANDFIEVGAKLERSVINKNGMRQGVLDIGDAGKDLSYFPFVLSITQDEHEAVLLRHLERRGVEVERGIEVVRMDLLGEKEEEAFVNVKVRNGNGTESDIKASYVIGCDGAHSGVRHATDISMEGGTYTRSFFVADVSVHGDMQTRGEVNICFSGTEFVIILALPHKENRARLVGFVPDGDWDLKDVTFEDCRPSIAKAAPGIVADEVRWFTTYKVHHRCATTFQHGQRVFLCGDSAHLHSPLGGQGMNTGLGDVSNLAWKLATAWHAEANSLALPLNSSHAHKLLATYSHERKPFADELVKTTDRAFETLIAQNFIGWLFRNVLLPYVFPLLASSATLRRLWFPRLSQIGIEYCKSALSEGNGRGQAVPGYRLPWLQNPGGATDGADNHSLLNGAGWQVHVFGTGRTMPESVQQLLHRRRVPIYTIPVSNETTRAGFIQDALYVIRPDGHVGLVMNGVSEMEAKLEKYVEEWGVCGLNSASENE